MRRRITQSIGQSRTESQTPFLRRYSFIVVFACLIGAPVFAVQGHVKFMSWWSEFSLARFFDSPVIFGIVMGIVGVFILFYIVVAMRTAPVERAAAAWAGDRGLQELVDALATADAYRAFVRLRYLGSERLYTWLLKRLPDEKSAANVNQLLADLPDKEENRRLGQELLSPETNKKTRQKLLVELFERRDEQLRRLLLAHLKQAKNGGTVDAHVVYLLEDLGASEARPALERLLAAGALPSPILENALRRIPQAQQAHAK